MYNIHVSETEVNDNKVVSVSLNFQLITEVGKMECKVIIGKDHDFDDRPKAYVSSYEILGKPYTKISFPTTMEKEGLRRLASHFQEVCSENGWNAWRY